MRTAVVNPLAGALAHYTDALVALMPGSVREDVAEPSLAGTGRVSWLFRYARALRRAARTAGPGGTVVITWPVIGYLDLVVLALTVPRAVRTMLVVHDPEPLVHAVGLGPLSRRIARVLVGRTTLVVHGADALSTVTDHGFGRNTIVLPHPVLPAAADPMGREREGRRRTDERPAAVIRVIGQWKPDRDTDVLESLAPVLADRFRLEVHGRGWPEVRGWVVHDRFVSEAELDALVADSAAVLVPYRRFFQSGVAIRALEAGTPFVGPRVEALAALVDDCDDVLVDRPDDVGAWVRAISAAVVLDPTALRARAAAISRRGSDCWRSAVGGASR